MQELGAACAGVGEEGQPLTIFKNLRVCGDCHNATKYASKVLGRKLVVKDANRCGVFEQCSCVDFLVMICVESCLLLAFYSLCNPNRRFVVQ